MYTSVRCIHVIVSGFAIRKKKQLVDFFMEIVFIIVTIGIGI